MAKGNPCENGCGRLTKSATGKCSHCRDGNRGRPDGAKTERIVVDSIATTCPKCGSWKRTKYENQRTKEIVGRLPDGRLFCQIEYRDCKCFECGQRRTDRRILPIKQKV